MPTQPAGHTGITSVMGWIGHQKWAGVDPQEAELECTFVQAAVTHFVRMCFIKIMCKRHNSMLVKGGGGE